MTMTNSRTIYIDGIGSILLEHSTHALQTTVTVKPKKGVIVIVPIRVSFEEAIEFVNRNEPWIRKNVNKIQQQELHQKQLDELFSNIDQQKAQKTIMTRLRALARKHGFTYSRVSISNHKTKWGNCSNKNAISLNTKLAVLPKELLAYVILRELVHTRIHSSSTRFWTELDKYVGKGQAKIIASKLREYSENLS